MSQENDGHDENWERIRRIYARIRPGGGERISPEAAQEINDAVRAVKKGCKPDPKISRIWEQVLTFPYQPIELGKVTDEMIAERMRGYFAQQRVVHTNGRTDALQGNTEKGVIYPRGGDISSEPESYLPAREVISPNSVAFPSLDKVGKELLESFLKDPFLGTVERYKELGINPKVGNRRKKKLLKLGLVSEVSVPASRGRMKLLDLTDKGFAVLKELCPNLDMRVSASLRHGGIEHRYGVEQAKKKFVAEGYTVEEEYPIGGGKTVDLVVFGKTKKFAVEVETGKSDALGNIRKCLEAGFDGVVSLATSKAVKERILSEVERLSEHEKGKVRVRRL